MKSNTPQPAPLHIQQPSKSPPGSFLSQVKTTGAGLPSRVVLYGVEGIGKTSWAAQARDPLFLQSRGETGLSTLLDSGLLDPTAYLPELMTWSDVLTTVRDIASKAEAGNLGYKTVVFDALNGFERLCHEHVCETLYRGDWGPAGFANYAKGYESALVEWRILLSLLDRLQRAKIQVILLAHSLIKPFRNPEGEDYDRYVVDLHHKTWGHTHKWADIVLFATYYTTVVQKDGKAKGTGGKQRVIYTERTAAFDAKNRHGLAPMIPMGNAAAEAWDNFITACKTAKSNATSKGKN